MRFRAFLSATLLVFAMQGASAQPDEGAAESGDETLVGAERYSADDIGRRREGEALMLSLIDAIRLGLKNNLAIEIQRYSPLISEQDQEGAWGSYDPTFYGEIGYQNSVVPNSFILNSPGDPDFDNINRNLDGVGGFRGILPYLGTSP